MRKKYKLTKKERKAMINYVAVMSDIDQVIALECAIQGRTWDSIERSIGCMSSNQWRACLEMSLNSLLKLE